MEEDNTFTKNGEKEELKLNNLYIENKYWSLVVFVKEINIPKWRKGKGISTLGVPAAGSKYSKLLLW